ncbi:homing endonuclease associated repeat-containing protein [Rhodoferax ferrireducens]|uniref:homing endonuclease associated repeat-containing protein n=1 Tax=Rhodoferax ferrireducens TaxID=192843 RepID=UPI003BB6169F
MHFELDHLESYDDQALIEELRRVAALVATPTLTIGQFTALAKVHGSTLQKRFGGWRRALEVAGLTERIDGSNLSKTREEILSAMAATAATLKKETITIQEFLAHTGVTGTPVRRIFGSWKSALLAAGMSQSPLAKRYTDEECFENMLAVWTHYGRPPQHDEMNQDPSQVGSKAYVRRWGTWRKALQAFVQRVNGDAPAPIAVPESASVKAPLSLVTSDRGPRDIPLALRYYVLKRDSFRCVTCGSSPAITRGVVLHIDHIHPWARGGATVVDNLRTLCLPCNLGKGVSPA